MIQAMHNLNLLQKYGMLQIFKQQKINTAKMTLLSLKQEPSDQVFIIILCKAI